MKTKNQQTSIKKQNNNSMKQYYTMDSTFLMQAANSLFNPVINEMVQGLAYQNSPFPDGEVICVICEGKKSWLSSSRESLLAIMQNKKEPMYHMNLDF